MNRWFRSLVVEAARVGGPALHQQMMRGEHKGFSDIETRDLLTGTGSVGSRGCGYWRGRTKRGLTRGLNCLAGDRKIANVPAVNISARVVDLVG